MIESARQPYVTLIRGALPRVLASFDRDPCSPTIGLGDRRYWAWKTQDFANATSQGTVNGLARLLRAELLPPEIDPASILQRCDEVIRATRRITARDGSLCEAFPTEKSFCVTALVAYDILVCADLVGDRVSSDVRHAWLETAAPLIDFVCRNEETHAIISNHLATAVAALVRWEGAGASVAKERARRLVAVILANQSAEGWFSEYGGADPGYESLGLAYLADAHLREPGFELAEPISRSLSFLVHFAHPDGSFAGGYGARNTRFLVPAAFEALAPTHPDAARLASFARDSAASGRMVTLAAIDEPNLAPHFNAWCWAAADAAPLAPRLAALPCENAEPSRRVFPQAGLLIDNSITHYTIVSMAKGGYMARYPKDGSAPQINAGVVGKRAGRLMATQSLRPENAWRFDGGRVHVEAPFAAVTTSRPTPIQFAVLRILSVTLFHWRPFTEWFKRLVVRRLITPQRKIEVLNRREISLEDGVCVDAQMPTGVIEVLSPERPFGVIHMASAGYWQQGDDRR